MERVTKFFPAEVKSYNDKDLTVDHFISTEAEDRSGDTVFADGIEFDAQPMVLKNHGKDPDTGHEPIARCESWRVTTVDGRKGMLVRTKYYDGSHLKPPDNTGRRLYEKAVGGFMPFWSIGFGIKEGEPKAGGRGRNLRKTVVYEYSQVGVPDNPTADMVKALPELLKAFDPEKPETPKETLSFAPAETKPKPKEGETRDDYLKRCIPMLIEEGKPQDQAAAICNSMWEDRDKGASPEVVVTTKSFAQDILATLPSQALRIGCDYFIGGIWNITEARELKQHLKEFGAFCEEQAGKLFAELQTLRGENKTISIEELKARLLSVETKVVAPSQTAAVPPQPTPAAPAAAPAPADTPALPVDDKSQPVIVIAPAVERKQGPQLLPFTAEQVQQAVREGVHGSIRREVRQMLGRVD